MDRNKAVVLPLLTWLVVIIWYLVADPIQSSALQSTDRLAQQDSFASMHAMP